MDVGWTGEVPRGEEDSGVIGGVRSGSDRRRVPDRKRFGSSICLYRDWRGNEGVVWKWMGWRGMRRSAVRFIGIPTDGTL